MRKRILAAGIITFVGLTSLFVLTNKAESSPQPVIEVIGPRVRTTPGNKLSRYVIFNLRNNHREQSVVYLNYTVHLFGDDGLEISRRANGLNDVPATGELTEEIPPGQTIRVRTRNYESYLWETTRAEITIRLVELWDGQKNEWTFHQSY